jgi:hypothetical protein
LIQFADHLIFLCISFQLFFSKWNLKGSSGAIPGIFIG